MMRRLGCVSLGVLGLMVSACDYGTRPFKPVGANTAGVRAQSVAGQGPYLHTLTLPNAFAELDSNTVNMISREQTAILIRLAKDSPYRNKQANIDHIRSIRDESLQVEDQREQTVARVDIDGADFKGTVEMPLLRRSPQVLVSPISHHGYQIVVMCPDPSAYCVGDRDALIDIVRFTPQGPLIARYYQAVSRAAAGAISLSTEGASELTAQDVAASSVVLKETLNLSRNWIITNITLKKNAATVLSYSVVEPGLNTHEKFAEIFGDSWAMVTADIDRFSPRHLHRVGLGAEARGQALAIRLLRDVEGLKLSLDGQATGAGLAELSLPFAKLQRRRVEYR